MTRNRNQMPDDPNQGALIDVAQTELGYGQRGAELTVHPEGMYPDEQQPEPPTEEVAPAADVRERAHLLLSSLGHLAQVSMRSGLKKGVHTGEQPRIKSSMRYDYEGTLEGAKFTKTQEMRRAKEDFRKAYDLGSDIVTDTEDPEFKIAFSEFTFKYGVGGNPEMTATKRARRETFRKVLKKITAIEGDFELQTFSTEPAAAPQETKTTERILEPELARTKEKLIGLRDDSRAGFLPTTHKEKSQAFELLDYLDLAKYPLGVNQRLDEIAQHQQKIAQDPEYEHNLKGDAIYWFSQDTVRSIINEWGDHLHSAIVSHDKLQALKEFLDSGISPRVSVGEATTTDFDEQFDYTELVRFINLKSLRDGNAIAFDPLRTKEDRTIVHPHKNKIIEDVHTAVGSPEEIQTYIDEVAQELSVKDGRQLINEALADQANRRIFWYRILKGVSEEGFQDKAEEALKSAGVPEAA